MAVASGKKLKFLGLMAEIKCVVFYLTPEITGRKGLCRKRLTQWPFSNTDWAQFMVAPCGQVHLVVGRRMMFHCRQQTHAMRLPRSPDCFFALLTMVLRNVDFRGSIAIAALNGGDFSRAPIMRPSAR